MVFFKKNTFYLFLLLLMVEVTIALYIRDKFVRPYLGDFLAVMLLYCFLKSFLKIRVVVAASIVLVFVYLVEFFQYIQITKILEVQDQKITSTVLGSQFDWLDILFYTAGILVIVVLERRRRK